MTKGMEKHILKLREKSWKKLGWSDFNCLIYDNWIGTLDISLVTVNKLTNTRIESPPQKKY
jgi:hypothetical protein